MKRLVFFVTLIPILIFISPLKSAAQQTPASDIESLRVDFWPDFDRPSVLVLMTGELPASSTLPAAVSIPLPSDAEINAVASVDGSDMLSVDFQRNGDEVSFTAPVPRFRVEYYVPYEKNGATRSYAFNWLSNSSVVEYVVAIQQPANAASLTSDPQATDVSTNQFDGLIYHSFSPMALPAGTPYRLEFSYDMASEELTVEPASTVPEMPVEAVSSGGEEPDNMLILLAAGVIGLVVLAIAGTWFVATRNNSRKSKRPLKPSPRDRPIQTSNIYCHVCGSPSQKGDQFCRKCGTKLKQL